MALNARKGHSVDQRNVSSCITAISQLLVYLIAAQTILQQVDCACNRVFKSTGNPSQAITRFEAPSRVSTKPFKVHRSEQGNLTVKAINANETDTKRDHLMHCVYKFIGNEDERVYLNFSSFRLRGDEPECSNEYVDIYIELKSEDKFETALNQGSGIGRFCSTITPRRLVSLHNMINIVFFSRLEPPANGKPLFTGSVSFAKVKPNDLAIGPSQSGTLCTHTINVSTKREGEFQSITYPGVYIKGLKCSYRFVGEAGQRIRLEFLDLDLYFGGPHCPMDSLKIFDGPLETDPIINAICGSHRNLIIYSSREHLLITFSTLTRESEVQNRGFSAYYEFSDKFFDLSFIQGSNAKHIRGSECDQRIVSDKGSKGIVVAPEPKNRSNAVCRYLFEGLQNSTDYEKVTLRFNEFDLKTQRLPIAAMSTTLPPPTSTTQASLLMHSSTSGSTSDTNLAANSTTEQCPDNYVRIYTGEQKPDPNDYDYVFCSNDIPQAIESDAASLLMEYNSGSVGGGFKAEYEFIVDYRIPGVQSSSSACDYLYRSDNFKSGTFNSPRHPSWYINDINCSYTFLTKPDESILLQFNTFKMANSFDEKVLGHGDACKGEDLVELFELVLDANERIISMTEIGTYCGTTTPGPILSYKPLKINFKTNKNQVHYGFSAIYNFYSLTELKTNDFVMNCGGQIHAGPKQKTGTIASPETYRSETYEKRHHICSWNITARLSNKIALDFNRFELEGSPTARGCITASVRLDLGGKNKTPIEICGTLSTNSKTTHQYVSENEWLGLTFISTKQASGSNGFLATWTEIKRGS